LRILIVGAEGTVGKTAAAELRPRHHIISAGRKSGDVQVDITDIASVHAMYEKIGMLDAVAICAGDSYFGPVSTMTSEQFVSGIMGKLMGQVNLVLAGLPHMNDAGSFTLTSGILSRDPVRQGSNAAATDGAIDAFVISAAIEMPRGIRINAVSPGLLQEAAAKYDGYFPGHDPVSSRRVGLAYAKSIEGAINGQVIKVD
jgi:NAD(P)-dependent dehydrogenase (short-subunit alcohol dehydrogenase family)